MRFEKQLLKLVYVMVPGFSNNLKLKLFWDRFCCGHCFGKFQKEEPEVP